ncbi:MAG: AI-2E family transporter [Chloroflexota bacterium]|nr:AI-2E family transporter [Chloroflexota bacterium]
MPSWFDSPRKRYRIVLVVAVSALIVGLFLAAWTALLPFFAGMILAYLLIPVVNFLDQHAPRVLQRKNISRPLAIVIVYIVGIGFVVGVVAYFVPVISQQMRAFGKAAPYYFRQIQELLRYDVVELLDSLPPAVRTWLEASIANLMNTLTNALQRGLEATIRTVSRTVGFLLGVLMVPFWLFYVLNDENEIRKGFYRLIPDVARADARCIVRIIDDLLSAYIRGQLLLALIVGVASTVALLLLGVNLAVLLGTIAGILDLIPIVGPWIGGVPAVLVALIGKPIRALWVALAFLAIQQLQGSLLVPHISGHAVRFHPATVMIVVVVGAEVAGLWGLLLCVPVAAIIRDVFHYLYLRTTEKGATPEMALEYLWSRRV